jgi:hypothetical protein
MRVWPRTMDGASPIALSKKQLIQTKPAGREEKPIFKRDAPWNSLLTTMKFRNSVPK